ncbi:MAG: trypsin-like peptidase domain-containing protein [Dehalococcoidia bacterium]
MLKLTKIRLLITLNIFLLIFTSLLLAIIFFDFLNTEHNASSTNLKNNIANNNIFLKDDKKSDLLLKEQSIDSLYPILEKTRAAVVSISTKGKMSINNNPFFNDPFFENFFRFNLPQQQEIQSIGSGVIINSQNGFILTNFHVVKDAEVINVTLFDERKSEAILIGYDEKTDLAILQIQEEALFQFDISKKTEISLGDYVLAIGNPFGLGHTVTYGIVSGINRSNVGIIKGNEKLIQIDANINPGNSGGALINLKGELIGINTAILSKGGANVGIGFAIPIQTVNKIANQLIQYGNIKRGQIGLSVKTIEILDNETNSRGIIVESVVPSSSSEKAGLVQGDIIIAIDSNQINTVADFSYFIDLERVSETIDVLILRNGLRKTYIVEVEPFPTFNDESSSGDTPPANIKYLQGATFMKKDNGIFVVSVEKGSNAYNIGLRKEDLIKQVNQKKVNNLNDLYDAMNSRNRGVMMQLIRGNVSVFIIRN